MQQRKEWWRGGVIYQVYPRSFYDSRGDGVGDLRGISEKLDYIASLNVDAIWLSPFFPSPMKDFGYDVSDYRGVDPMFGTLDDLKILLAQAHSRGLKVIIDQVLSHCSDRHPWFRQSCSSRDGVYADWFVWADPKPDGTPPNNWQSVFGGPAWQWNAQRGQYYLHNFLASQPDLNFYCPSVRAQLLSDVEYWLEMGVDGFRLDAANFFFHDQALRDNPPRPRRLESDTDRLPESPYGYQRHIYDKSRPETVAFLRTLRSLLDRYPGAAAVAEVGCDNGLNTMAAYTGGGDTLHMAYSFDLLTERCCPAHIRATMEGIEAVLNDGWACWSLSNHDVTRVATRWAIEGKRDPTRVCTLLALVVSLRGSICIYQGEELGLTEATLAYEDLVDPYGLTFWPQFKGRDGCRTPMPWTRKGDAAGFSSSRPWLPVPDDHRLLAVDEQDGDPTSSLNACRKLLAWRRNQPVLIEGDISMLHHDDALLIFERKHRACNWLCLFNLGESTRQYVLPEGAELLKDVPGSALTTQSGALHLPAQSFGYVRLAH